MFGTSGVRYTDLKYLKSFKEGEESSKFQDIRVIQEKTKGSLARDAVKKMKSGGIYLELFFKVPTNLQRPFKAPSATARFTRPQTSCIIMERMLYGRMLTFQRYTGTLQTGRKCQFHECQINVSEYKDDYN